jgi:microcystin degradation protein MlrC
MDTKYIIFDLSEIDKINFNEILNTSVDTLRLSTTNKSIIKYIGIQPNSIQLLQIKSQEYTNSEILDILTTDEWILPYISYSGDTI